MKNQDFEKEIQEKTTILQLQLKKEIEKRKKVEKAFKESEEKFRLLVENVKYVVFIVQEEVIISLNPSTENIAGYSTEELAKGSFINFIHPEEKDMVYDKYNKILQGEEGPGKYSFRVISKTGEELWIELSAVLIKWKGKPAILTFIRDITDERHIKIQLERAQKLESLGTLAGGVAHDLNNVLSGIVSYPDILLIKIPQDSPLRKPILIMQASGKKAAAMVQDLLTLARRGVSIAEVVNLNSTIVEYLKSPEFEKMKSFHPGLEIETMLEKNLMNVSGSPIHLSKTIMNLASNAAEAMPQGGKIIIYTGNTYIDKPIRGYDDVKEGDYVTVSVSDTGMGISDSEIERIFEPFFSKKEMGRSGTGLGMTVVWSTVKDHKGYIDVLSTEGKGTTFKLYFPVTRQKLIKEKELFIKDYMGKGESILVVDDIKEQREIATNMLATLGYWVKSVSSGEEAMEYLKEHTVDLIVLDMVMDPSIDGLDTYKKILELHPGQKAIIASGFSETDRVKEAQKLGAEIYVKKPYTLAKLGISVKTELEK